MVRKTARRLGRFELGKGSCLALVLSVAAAFALTSCKVEDSPGARTEKMLANTEDGTNWAGYGRTFDENHYSPLNLINESNIGQLGLAWSLDLPVSASAVAAPLAVDGILYVASGLSVVRAIVADTGKELWSYDPGVGEVAGDALKPAWGIRGIAYWGGNVYVGTQEGRLIALKADTGKVVWSVATTTPGDGRYITGAPRVFKGKVIIGHGGADFSPVRGYVTAYDATTGKQLWRFYTVPGNPKDGFENKAMEEAAKTWNGEWWKFGGGGTVWNSMTYDPEFNRIYIGTGNGAPWNQKIRSPGGGDNLYVCSIIALDADTGEYVWHYQINPAESWDYNAAMDIELATLKIAGESRQVILHAPKNGFFYVIDRKTGKLISAEPYEKVTWATKIDLETGRPVETPEARFPTGEGLLWPSGGIGAHSWVPMAFNPKTNLVYIPTIHLPGYYNDKGIDPKTWSFEPGAVLNNGFNPVFPVHGAEADAKPAANAPPPEATSSLQAWDPVQQKQVWSVPLTGPSNGGVLSTAGGLIFQGQAAGKFVAYAGDTGKSLWSFDAQNGILSQPITYMAGGKQYVTVIAGYGGASPNMGALSTQFGWDYRTQVRRVLTFVVGGQATLAASNMEKAPIVEDPTFVADEDTAHKGALVYSKTCLFCHGFEAESGGTAPDLRRAPAILSHETFMGIVHEGGLQSQGMPKFDNFTEEQLEHVRFYLRDRAAAARKKNRALEEGTGKTN